MHPSTSHLDYRVRYLREVIPMFEPTIGEDIFTIVRVPAAQPSVCIVNVRTPDTVTFGTSVYNPNDAFDKRMTIVTEKGQFIDTKVFEIRKTPYNRKYGIQIALNNLVNEPVTVPLVPGMTIKNHFRAAVEAGMFGAKTNVLKKFIGEDHV